MSKQELDAYNSMNEDYYKFFIELNKSNPYNSFSVYPRSTPGLKIELKNSFVRNDISQWNKQVLILFWEGFNNYICKTNIGSVALTNANTIDYPDSQKQYMHNINSLKINYKYVDIEAISTQNIESDYYRALRFWVKKQIKLNYEINLSPSEIEQLNNFEISKIQ